MTEVQRLVAQLFRKIALLEKDDNQPEIQEIRGIISSLWEMVAEDEV